MSQLFTYAKAGIWAGLAAGIVTAIPLASGIILMGNVVLKTSSTQFTELLIAAPLSAIAILPVLGLVSGLLIYYVTLRRQVIGSRTRAIAAGALLLLFTAPISFVNAFGYSTDYAYLVGALVVLRTLTFIFVFGWYLGRKHNPPEAN